MSDTKTVPLLPGSCLGWILEDCWLAGQSNLHLQGLQGNTSQEGSGWRMTDVGWRIEDRGSPIGFILSPIGDIKSPIGYVHQIGDWGFPSQSQRKISTILNQASYYQLRILGTHMGIFNWIYFQLVDYYYSLRKISIFKSVQASQEVTYK